MFLILNSPNLRHFYKGMVDMKTGWFTEINFFYQNSVFMDNKVIMMTQYILKTLLQILLHTDLTAMLDGATHFKNKIK